MITTPEQMREAANNDEDLIRRIDAITVAHQYTTSLDDPRMFAEMRAIPIAPQPSENRLFDPDSHWGDFIRSAVAEAEKAMRKYPQPNYVITKVAEEAGEVVKAAVHAAEGRETLDNVRGEMLQLVAMLFRLWLEGDQVHGLPPVSGVMAVSANTTAPQPVAVTVKPLVWEDLGNGSAYRAACPLFGSIRAESYGSGGFHVLWSVPGFCDSFTPGLYETAELAKAAAQADYEARTLSALTIHPADPLSDPLSDPRVKALVEALEWMEDYALAFPDLELIMEKAREALNAIGGEA